MARARVGAMSDPTDVSAEGPDSTGPDADVAELAYEPARDELVRIVAQLEGGQVSLEESMRLWRRGEALAAHCEGWLARAEAAVRQVTSTGEPSPSGER